jgi:DNA-3-methyladenine glycosylase II
VIRALSAPGGTVATMSTVGRTPGGTRTFTIRPDGPFDLRESVEFGFGQRHHEAYAGLMRLAFVLDETAGRPYGGSVGVVVRQDGAVVHAEVAGDLADGDLDRVRAQVARILSLDVDARPFADGGSRDPVIGRLQQQAPGLRPPLFHSPYEAAAWSVLSARRPAQQMAQVRARLSADHGRTFALAGVDLAAFPTPDQLLAVQQVDGLTDQKVARLHGVARAAQEGLLDAARLRSLDPAQARQQVQALDGIGPFYADLIVVRALGRTDELPGNEPRLMALVGELYGYGRPVDAAELELVARAWRPFRTWAAVLVRAVAGRARD